MMLCGGQGRSLKSNCFVDCTGAPPVKGPSIVDSSPGAKLIIVDNKEVDPHESVASILWKFA